MNSSDVKATASECNAWSSKPLKKSKKKKRRNKHKLYNSKLKKHKRKSNFPGNKPLLKLQSQFTRTPIMSNWYWSNYKIALDWREKHELAHWKACALALQEENRYLIGIINQMRPGSSPHVSVTWENLEKNKRRQDVRSSSGGRSSDEENDNEDERNSDEEVEFEMSEEMIEFFRESMRHKENLRKVKEQEAAEKVEEEVKQLQSNRLRRNAEMQLLYGEGASMIIGMETAIQLSYEKFCDSKSPKYWPNIPFRL